MKNNIFCRLAKTKAVRAVRLFYEQHREFILFLMMSYLFAFLNIGLFWLFTQPLQLDPHIANALSWSIRVVLAYLSNRLWLFSKNKAQGAKGIAREAAAYVLSRLSALGIEEVTMIVGFNLLGLDSMIVKLISQVVVFFSNYLFSKYLVFRKRKNAEDQNESTEEESNA